MNKQLDLIVYNPLVTLNSMTIDAVLIWPRWNPGSGLGKIEARISRSALDRSAAGNVAEELIRWRQTPPSSSRFTSSRSYPSIGRFASSFPLNASPAKRYDRPSCPA